MRQCDNQLERQMSMQPAEPLQIPMGVPVAVERPMPMLRVDERRIQIFTEACLLLLPQGLLLGVLHRRLHGVATHRLHGALSQRLPSPMGRRHRHLQATHHRV